jgi:hypothetical protein
MDVAERRTRLAAQAALSDCNCPCPAHAEKLLWDQIEALLATAAWAMVAAGDLPAGPAHFGALQRSLSHEVDKSIAGILHLLACLSSKRTVDDARQSLLHGSVDQRAYALEAIEQILPLAIRARVMALLEPITSEERRKALTPYFPQSSLPLEARLADILSANDRIGPWTATVTLFAAAKSEIRLSFDSAVLAKRFDEDVFHETLQWSEAQQIPKPPIAETTFGLGERVG